jgi:hypothetical protein
MRYKKRWLSDLWHVRTPSNLYRALTESKDRVRAAAKVFPCIIKKLRDLDGLKIGSSS